MYNEEKFHLRIDPDHVSTIIDLLIDKMHTAELMERLCEEENDKLKKEIGTLKAENKQLQYEYDDMATKYVSMQTMVNALPAAGFAEDGEPNG